MLTPETASVDDLNELFVPKYQDESNLEKSERVFEFSALCCDISPLHRYEKNQHYTLSEADYSELSDWIYGNLNTLCWGETTRFRRLIKAIKLSLSQGLVVVLLMQDKR